MSAGKFAERITSDLRSATHDKHIALYFDTEVKQASVPESTAVPREHYNYGFNKVERLRGNVGYRELRSFANLPGSQGNGGDRIDRFPGRDESCKQRGRRCSPCPM